MKQVVAYRLAEGIMPSFISDGGYLRNNDLLIGITIDGLPLPESVSVFNTKEELLAYVNTFYVQSQVNLNTTEGTKEEAVDFVWAKL